MSRARGWSQCWRLSRRRPVNSAISDHTTSISCAPRPREVTIATCEPSWLRVPRSNTSSLTTRSVSTSAPLQSARWTNQKEDKTKNWRKYLSKRARKRRKRKIEKWRAQNPPPKPPMQTLPKRSLQEEEEIYDQHKRVAEMIAYRKKPVATMQQALEEQDPDILWSAMREETLDNNVKNYSHLLHVLGTQGRIADMMAAYEEMFDVGLEPNTVTYTNMISACANQRNVEAALHILEMMKSAGVVPNEVTFGAAMKACIRCNALEKAFALLGQAERSGVPMNAELFTHLVVGCIRQGNIDLAWKTFDHMRIWHCAPDAVAYTAMISACGRTDNVERALNLYNEMLQYGVFPTHVTFNALIYACGRSFRRYQHAFNLVEEMKANGYAPDVRTYNSLILACSHSGEVNKAKKFMYDLHSEGLKPDIVTYNTLLSVYARAMVEHGPKARRKQLDRMDPEERREAELESKVSGEDLLAIDYEEPNKQPSSDLKAVSNQDLKELSVRLLSEYYGTKHREGTTDYSKQELDMLDQGPDHPAFDPPSSEPGEGSWTELKESSYQQDRQSWVEAGMSEGAIRDMEWEFVHGRPDTDTDNADPEVQEIIRRRVRRGQDIAKKESAFRDYMGLGPSQFQQQELEEEEELRDIAEEVGSRLPDHLRTSIPTTETSMPREEGALQRFQRYFENIRARKQEEAISALKSQVRSRSKTGLQRKADNARVHGIENQAMQDNERLLSVVTRLFSHPEGSVNLEKIAESSGISHSKLLKLKERIEHGVSASIAVTEAGIDPEYEMSRLISEVGHDIHEAYNTEPDTEAELEKITVDGVPATEYIYKTDSENDWKPDFTKDDISKMGDVVDDKLEADYQRKLKRVSEELDRQLLAWGDKETTDQEVEQSGHLHDSYKRSLEREQPAIRTLLGSEFLQNPDTPQKVKEWHSYLDLIGNLSESASLSAPRQRRRDVSVERLSDSGETVEKPVLKEENPDKVLEPQEKGVQQAARQASENPTVGKLDKGFDGSAEPYSGYDSTHIVSSNGIVWEPVADNEDDRPAGLVRRRRSGWAIEGCDYLPRPASLVRSENEDVSCFLTTDPGAVKQYLDVQLSESSLNERNERLTLQREVLEDIETHDSLSNIEDAENEDVYSKFIRDSVQFPDRAVGPIINEEGSQQKGGETDNVDMEDGEANSWTDSVPQRNYLQSKQSKAPASDKAEPSTAMSVASLDQMDVIQDSIGSAISGPWPENDDKPSIGYDEFDQEVGSLLDDEFLGRLGEQVGENISKEFGPRFSMSEKRSSHENSRRHDSEQAEPEIQHLESIKDRMRKGAREHSQPLGEVEQALIQATDSRAQAQKRQDSESGASVVDAFLGVKKFQEGWMDNCDLYDENISESIKGITASTLGDSTSTIQTNNRGTDNADNDSDSTGILSKYGQKVMDARARLATAISPGSKGELRLRALQKFSEELFAGAHWAPTELPQDVNEARKVFLEESFNTYEELKRSGYEPDKFTLNSIVAACANAGKAKVAYNFIQEEFRKFNVIPDERTFRSLLRMHQKARRMDLCELLLSQINQHGIQLGPDSYGILVHGYARDYRIADALDVLRSMKEKNIECPERYAFLLRQRCKELSIWHELVPDHPNAWQFSPRAKSHKRSKGKHVNVMKTLVSHQIYNQGAQ